MNRVLLTSTVLAASWPAWASAADRIIDRAGMFSADAVRSAEDSLQHFKRRTGADVVVETIPDLRAIDGKINPRLPPTESDRILAKAAKDRAKAKKINGLYILICREPEKLKFESARNVINPQDTQAVVQAVMSSLKNREFDGALSNLATSLEKVEASPAKSASAAGANQNDGGGLGTMWTVLLVLLGVWLVFGLMRGLSGAGGGGGFFPSMLGGLFGGMAGMWLYDSMFRGGGLSGSEGGSDGYSGGGDWGDSGTSGGGDWGGGGDFGSGGDF
jgi:uncharacterized membrane protein YgcG